MRTNKRLAFAGGVVALCVALPATAGEDPDRSREAGAAAVIAPVDSMPAGQSYGRWAAQWYQWALGVPAAVNPASDPTGEHCAERQVGPVWFLAGTWSSATSSASRSCTVPAGKALFFPLINAMYGAWLSDPPDTRTEAFARANGGSCSEPAHIAAWIDDTPVMHPKRYFTGPGGSPSPVFYVQLPPGNLWGYTETDANGRPYVPELVLNPAVEQGYYLFVKPLPRGTHTIRWIATGCTQGAVQDIRYTLTVQ